MSLNTSKAKQVSTFRSASLPMARPPANCGPQVETSLMGWPWPDFVNGAPISEGGAESNGILGKGAGH